MIFWMQYNPLDMALKAGDWFLYGADHFSPQGYEICTAALWIILCGDVSADFAVRKKESSFRKETGIKGGKNRDRTGIESSVLCFTMFLCTTLLRFHKTGFCCASFHVSVCSQQGSEMWSDFWLSDITDSFRLYEVTPHL